MQERVNIQYSVTIDELKNEIERLMLKAGEEISSIDVDFSESGVVFSTATIDYIKSARASMMRADMRLEDVSKMITGFLSYKTTDNAHQTTHHTQDQQEPDNVEALKSKLKAFKESLADVELDNEAADSKN